MALPSGPSSHSLYTANFVTPLLTATPYRGIRVVLKNALRIGSGPQWQSDPDGHVKGRIQPAADAGNFPEAVRSPVDDWFVLRLRRPFINLHRASDREHGVQVLDRCLPP
jgi:hypothetical protein